MSKKHVKARQDRNRELGKRDNLNRCTFCRRTLPRGYIVRHADGGKFCTAACEADDAERTALMEARR